MKQNSVYGMKCVLGILLAVAVIPLAAVADSSAVTYQGTLRQPTSIPVADGNYAMAFALWDAETGGTQLWTESHAAVPVREGLFSVQLGSNTAFGSLFADHNALWLEVTADAGGGPEVYGPRMPFSGVPYALQAEHADSVTTAANAAHAATADTAANATHAVSADSATTAATAANAGNTARLGGQLPAFYAPASHAHNASAIVSGTLSADRYSAYADLTAEGKIGTAAAQVAPGDHNHTSLPYFTGWLGGELSGVKGIGTGSAIGIGNTGTALVAPVTGLYYVHYRQLHASTPAAFYLEFRVNGVPQTVGYMTGSNMHDTIVERLVWLNAGDQISFAITANAAAGAWGGPPHSTVTMHLAG